MLRNSFYGQLIPVLNIVLGLLFIMDTRVKVKIKIIICILFSDNEQNEQARPTLEASGTAVSLFLKPTRPVPCPAGLHRRGDIRALQTGIETIDIIHFLAADAAVYISSFTFLLSHFPRMSAGGRSR